MGYLDITPSLIGSLAECYYKEYCDQKGGWAYTSLEQIHKNGFSDGKLEFKIGFQRFKIKIPAEIVDEVKKYLNQTICDQTILPMCLIF